MSAGLPNAPRGATGLQGPQGPQGPQGIQGIPGLQGIEGSRGNQGPQGPTGVAGVRGFSTDVGAMGPTGPVSPAIVNTTTGSLVTSSGSTGILGQPNVRFDTGLLTVTHSDIVTNDTFRVSNGTASLPSYSFTNDVTTGMFLPASNSFAISVAGTEDIRILSNGNVGIGLTNPSFQLQLSTDSAAKLTTNTWSTTSDSRVKNAIVDADISMCYDTLKQLKLRRFEWDSSWNSAIEDKHAIGFIAQEVKQYFPKAVKTMDMYGYSDFHTLDVDQIYKTMYGALAHAIVRIETLKDEVQKLENLLSNK